MRSSGEPAYQEHLHAEGGRRDRSTASGSTREEWSQASSSGWSTSGGGTSRPAEVRTRSPRGRSASSRLPRPKGFRTGSRGSTSWLGEAAIEYIHRMDYGASGAVGSTRNSDGRISPGSQRPCSGSLRPRAAREKSLDRLWWRCPRSGSARPPRGHRYGQSFIVRRTLPWARNRLLLRDRRASPSEPSLIFLSVFPAGKSARIVCFVGHGRKSRRRTPRPTWSRSLRHCRRIRGRLQTFAQGGGPLV